MICGLDEAGCGPLAGPVTAGAAVLPPDFPVGMLRDSKQLSEKKRLLLYDLICERAAARATAFVWPEEIDRINIRQAALKAMAEAFDRVRKQLPDVTEWRCLADGNQVPPVAVPCTRYMLEADKLYPEYGFRRHKGYPTAEHREICKKIGLSPIHRRSFRIR